MRLKLYLEYIGCLSKMILDRKSFANRNLRFILHFKNEMFWYSEYGSRMSFNYVKDMNLLTFTRSLKITTYFFFKKFRNYYRMHQSRFHFLHN